jgi:hypothetical protein
MSTFKRPKLPGASPSHLLGEGDAQPRSPRTTEDVLARYAQERVSRLMGLSDATGSMSRVWRTTRGYIRALLKRVGEIGSLEVNWVAYRDYDMKSEILESSGWHRSSEPLIRFIEGITCQGGGDFPEAVEVALKYAADDKMATRVVLIGDAPPHPERNYRAQAGRLAQLSRPVYGFVVGQDRDTFRAFEEISSITGGVCTTLGSEQDLLDLVAMTAAHDIGGSDAVETYLSRHSHQLHDGARNYAQKLLRG